MQTDIKLERKQLEFHQHANEIAKKLKEKYSGNVLVSILTKDGLADFVTDDKTFYSVFFPRLYRLFGIAYDAKVQTRFISEY